MSRGVVNPEPLIQALSKLDVKRYSRVVGDEVDVADLCEFGIDEDTRIALEQHGLMPRPLKWDVHTGDGLAWERKAFESVFFKVVETRGCKRVLKPKNNLDWVQTKNLSWSV